MAKTKDGKKRVLVHGYNRGESEVRTHFLLAKANLSKEIIASQFGG